MIELRPRILGFTPALEAPVHVLGLQGASVVIVDDEETARFLLDEMMRGIDPGIESSVFASGIEALAWLVQREHDLVITDDRMTGGELVTVAYDKLFAITSCVAGVQELVVAAQRYITDLEAQLTRPLRSTED